MVRLLSTLWAVLFAISTTTVRAADTVSPGATTTSGTPLKGLPGFGGNPIPPSATDPGIRFAGEVTIPSSPPAGASAPVAPVNSLPSPQGGVILMPASAPSAPKPAPSAPIPAGNVIIMPPTGSTASAPPAPAPASRPALPGPIIIADPPRTSRSDGMPGYIAEGPDVTMNSATGKGLIKINFIEPDGQCPSGQRRIKPKVKGAAGAIIKFTGALAPFAFSAAADAAEDNDLFGRCSVSTKFDHVLSCEEAQSLADKGLSSAADRLGYAAYMKEHLCCPPQTIREEEHVTCMGEQKYAHTNHHRLSWQGATISSYLDVGTAVWAGLDTADDALNGSPIDDAFTPPKQLEAAEVPILNRRDLDWKEQSQLVIYCQMRCLGEQMAQTPKRQCGTPGFGPCHQNNPSCEEKIKDINDYNKRSASQKIVVLKQGLGGAIPQFYEPVPGTYDREPIATPKEGTILINGVPLQVDITTLAMDLEGAWARREDYCEAAFAKEIQMCNQPAFFAIPSVSCKNQPTNPSAMMP